MRTLRPGGLDGASEVAAPEHRIDGGTRSWLYGFWNPLHAVASEPVLVFGDKAKFERDKRRAIERAQERLGYLANNRWLLIEEWDETQLVAEEVYGG